MNVEGYISREGKWWAVEIPMLDSGTQGHTKEEAYAMAADLVQTMIGREGVTAQVARLGGDRLVVSCSDAGALAALILRRQRERSGLSLAQVAERLGIKSRNAYARYEQGKAVPTVAKFLELLAAVAPGHAFVLQDAGAV